MLLDKVVLTGHQLARIDGFFASTRPTYSKQVTILFTDGKSDARWRGMTEGTGVTFTPDVKVDEQKRRCTATCLVDLYACLGESKTQAWRPRGRAGTKTSVSPSMFRRGAILTVVHELVHVTQGWQIGKQFARDFEEEAISSFFRAADYARADPLELNSAYLQNMFERGAFDFTSRWMERCSDAVNAGEFDFLLPMATVRGIFADAPGVFH